MKPTPEDRAMKGLRDEIETLRAESARLAEEVKRVSSRSAEIHGALNVTTEEKRRLEAALEAAVQVSLEQPATPSPPATPGKVAPGSERTASLKVLAGPAAIEVRNLSKSYRLPTRPMDTLKEQVLHPLHSRRWIELKALDDVSFDVRRGEFLGIAGANGSGKSTLLKILANVYASDSGTIRTAGRVAPFIELGVGLNPDLAAFDNVVISGVMMGLTPAQARELYPRIIEFAGLESFTAVKLKNYSSGMQVRLAFAVMAQVDADILLIDEVLAVGDAEFREKCLSRLRELRDGGTTIVLVTHSMETLAAECDRGILLAEGVLVHEGDPAKIAQRYLEELQPPAAGPAEPEEPASLRLVEDQ